MRRHPATLAQPQLLPMSKTVTSATLAQRQLLPMGKTVTSAALT